MTELQTDTPAIQRLEQLISASQSELETHIPALIVPEGNRVQDVEHLLARPLFQRATYSTERLEDFCRYVETEAEEQETACFVDPDGSGADAYIDHGNHGEPGWGRHRARLRMQYTPEFKAVQAATQLKLTQRTLADFLEDWSDIITPMRDGEVMEIPQALGAIRRVDLKASRNTQHEEGDFRASRSSMEEIEAKAADGRALPEVLAVTCQVYPCTRQQDLKLRLSLLTSEDKPHFRLRLMAEDALFKAVADEVEMSLKERLQSIALYVGSMRRG